MRIAVDKNQILQDKVTVLKKEVEDQVEHETNTTSDVLAHRKNMVKVVKEREAFKVSFAAQPMHSFDLSKLDCGPNSS